MRSLIRLFLASGVSAVPGLAYAQSAPPTSAGSSAPNDYATAASWLCRPGRQDACAIDLSTTVISANGTRRTESWRADPGAPVDCFYVYPTVSRDTTAYSDMVAGAEERDVIREQFARFGSVCRPYAPLYRQVTLPALRASLAARGSGGAGPSLSQGRGYTDVLAAWNHYLSHDNNGRGVVLIGHSQGAMVLTELIRREIEGKVAQSRVVSAILLGTTIPVPRGKDVGGAFASMPLCRRAAQTGCVITFASFRANLPPPPNSLFGRVADGSMEAACTNPAALSGASAELHAHLGADGRLIASPRSSVKWDSAGPVETPFVSLPGLLTAQCVSNEQGGFLSVTVNGNPDDARTDDIPGDVGAPGRALAEWGLHLVDVNLVMGNLVDLVRAQNMAYQAPRPAAQTAAAIPRTAAGRPDLNGIWQAMTTAHYDLEPHAARAALAMRPGPVVPVPARDVVALGAIGAVPAGNGVVVGGAIPYTEAGRKRREENRAGYLTRDPEIKCYLPGVPRATYMPFPFQIFQSDKAFFLAYEFAGAARQVYLKDPGPPQVDTWMGQSVGRWDGDTFVVEATGFNDQSWFDRAGNHHTEGLKVVERYTMTSPHHILYEATIEDSATFTRPWTIRLPLYKHVDEDARLGQFKCVEFVEELLYGHLRKTPIKP